MNFDNFLKMTIPMMAIYVKNLKIHINGEFVEIRKLILIIIFVIFPQKCQFRLKNESFDISQNSAFVKIVHANRICVGVKATCEYA